MWKQEYEDELIPLPMDVSDLVLPTNEDVGSALGVLSAAMTAENGPLPTAVAAAVAVLNAYSRLRPLLR